MKASQCPPFAINVEREANEQIIATEREYESVVVNVPDTISYEKLKESVSADAD